MRLAYLSESKIPSREANSIHVMKMCQAFGRLEHEVTLVAPGVRSGLEAGVSDPYAFYGVDPCFRLVRRRWPAFKGGSWAYGWNAGVFTARLGVDAAYGRSLPACAVAARLGVPTIWDAHMPSFLRRRHSRWLFRLLIGAPGFRGLTANCDALRQEVVVQVPELADRIVVAHNGADPPSDAHTPYDLGKTRGRLQVGYVGHLYAGKGFEIIRALASHAPWADFHVVGGDQETVDALRRDPTTPGNIRLHGFVAPSETEQVRQACDVLLAPYQSRVRIARGGETAAWMSPLKLFEYMASGKPILCSDLPVLREVIENDRNGVLLPWNDPAAWAAALRRLNDNPAERERLGAAARADFLARHTWRQRAIRVLDGFLPVK